MKTQADAEKLLAAAGWSDAEIQSVVCEPLAVKVQTSESPWWMLLQDDEYLDGSPLVSEWVNWVGKLPNH